MRTTKRLTLFTAVFALLAGGTQPAYSAERREPAATATTEAVFMVWKGVNGDEHVWWNRLNADGVTWTGPQIVPGANSSAGVALVGSDRTRFTMAWKGVNGDQRIWVNNFANNAWTTPQPLAGAASSVGPGGTNMAGPWLAWKGVEGDQAIWWTHQFNDWSAPQKIPGAFSSFGPAMANRQVDARTVEPIVTWKGVDGDQRIWWNNYNSVTNTWTGPQVVPGANTSAGTALASVGGEVYAAWKGVGGDERIWWNKLPQFSSTWTAPQVVPGANSSVGPALARRSGVPYLTWKGVNGDERIWWSRLDGGSWKGPEVVPGASTSFRPALGSAYPD
ncbi:hypothetical protein ACFOY4_27690 [Actinomadura syzygii]|uniref:Carbohydrate-binding protein n=1 Tax=Actinomadura syzygii TaxID=1427538 RepID=A0A5D0UFZ4_9ACTN|nr:hypothetical protein [Actinomadura syzygii]TYC17411.1 hypothetical protein FXF65_05200 [Actinomadura syzygii]